MRFETVQSATNYHRLSGRREPELFHYVIERSKTIEIAIMEFVRPPSGLAHVLECGWQNWEKRDSEDGLVERWESGKLNNTSHDRSIEQILWASGDSEDTHVPA